MNKAMFGAGCFWGVEDAFMRINGVTKTAVGFSGGHKVNPTYEDVCYSDTGHAEVLYLEFDPAIVTYEELLKEFWEIHDPTQLNRQGPDIGSQYRSVIFYYDNAQKEAAEKSKAALQRGGELSRPVVTQIEPAGEFYLAEEYHQRYFEKTGRSSCHIRRK